MVSINVDLNVSTLVVFPICCMILYSIAKKVIYEKFINATIDLSPNNLNGKLVLITGCDSGFGYQASIALYKMGFSMFATCLTEKGKRKLMQEIVDINKNNNSFDCMIVDITKQEHIIGMKAYLMDNVLANKKKMLWSIINNAGIMKTAEFDLLTMDDFKQVMDVNLFGSIRVIKAFIHILRKTKHSRLINVVSAGIYNPMYAYCAYLTSKAALETLTIILRSELASFKCYVSSILPGANNTNLLNAKNNMQFYKNRVCNLDKNVLNDYGTEYFELSAKKCILGSKYVTPNKLDKVVNKMIDAVIRQRPYKRYVVGYDATFQYLLSYFPLFIQEFVISEPLRPWCTPKIMQS